MDKKYRFKQTEQAMQQLWQDNNVYAFDPTAEGAIYSIDTPPPTVSGSLHIGHIFSYTQAEMIARFRRMQGYNVFYPFGFDDNGLPTERLVERECGIRARDIPRTEFIDQCQQISSQYEENFKALWQSLGFSVDWELEYRTIDPKVQRMSQRMFLDLVAKDKAYMQQSPVLWCTECRTSIAQAELDTSERDSMFNYIPFYVGDRMLEVATTRPELLNGCVCLFVHPDDARYQSDVGQMAKVPLYAYDIPILTDEAVSMDKGTGVVMCATFGDSTDAEWIQKHQLPIRRVIMEDGRIAEDDPFLGGLYVKKARAVIRALLEERGLMLRSERIQHTVACHERCGCPVEIIPSKQWYIDIMSGKEQFLQAADQINWYPQHMKRRYIDWVENLKWDWCISRQRYFGVPFPVWYCADCGHAVYATADQLPINPQDMPYMGSCECGCGDFLPEAAVMDTWATSSLTPMINARFGEADDRSEMIFPMGLRTQAHEIIRTWAFYTIVRSLYHTGQLPWKDIMVCGFVLAKRGEKISKSKNNASLSPKSLVERHSADIIRYWSANAKLGSDTFFAEDELKIARRFITKLWNASKFTIMHLQDVDLQAEILLPVDRWIIARSHQCMNDAAELLRQYEIGAARHVVDEFFWKDFCDDYLEIIKERLYQPEERGCEARRSGQRALYTVLRNILLMYAPYVPHVTEAIYQQFFRERETILSLHQMKWTHEALDDELLRFGTHLRTVIAQMRRDKTAAGLSMGASMDTLCITVPESMEIQFQQTLPDIQACARAARVEMRME